MELPSTLDNLLEWMSVGDSLAACLTRMSVTGKAELAVVVPVEWAVTWTGEDINRVERLLGNLTNCLRFRVLMTRASSSTTMTATTPHITPVAM